MSIGSTKTTIAHEDGAAPAVTSREFVRVGTLAELRSAPGGVRVVRGADRPIAVFAGKDGTVAAVDNRCPHMGFPLHKGTIEDGILTCHWHEARFDLKSGCTFDLFADDVPVYEVQVRDGDVVWVSALPRQSGDASRRYQAQLRKGMEQNVSLIQAKAIIGLLRSGASVREIVLPAARFGTRERDGWNGNNGGMTFLTCAANLAPLVGEETAVLALFQGTAQAAGDCANQPPRRDRDPLDNRDAPLPTLKRWLLHWTRIRHRDAAERTLQTAIVNGAPPAQLCDLLFSAATERFYADGGHVLDEINKAAELLDLIGWEHAADVLPSLISHLVSARGGEEIGAWRHPVDLVPPLTALANELPDLLQTGAAATENWDDVAGLAHALLGGEDPLANLAALKSAFAAGARPIQAARALAYAAGLRVARFSASNEVGDWITVLHTFTYCSALHQAVKRCPDSPLVLRGVFHGAVAVYLDRFLNVPPARLPGEQKGDEEAAANDAPADALLDRFFTLLDGQQKGQPAARVIARYLEGGHPLPPLFDALTRSAMREDVNFHTIQMLEAGIRQFREWGEGTTEGTHLLFAVARYLAAHAPTRRARLQTATIALRLHRGDNIFEEDTL